MGQETQRGMNKNMKIINVNPKMNFLFKTEIFKHALITLLITGENDQK